MNKKGFATLMLVIIVSGIISVTLFSVVFESYLAQSNFLDKELKEESKFSAISCITAITLLFAEFGKFNEETLQVIGVQNCMIHSITVAGENRTVEVESTVDKFYTLLKATIKISSNKIISLEELSTF